MSTLTQTAKFGALAAVTAAPVGVAYFAAPHLAEVASSLTPHAGTAFGMALPVAAFTTAIAGGAVLRAARWFLSAAPIETTAPERYVRGMWDHVNAATATSVSALPAVQNVTPTAIPVDATLPSAQASLSDHVDADLRIIVETIQSPGVLLNEIDAWVKNKSFISDADFYYLLEKMPRGRAWGYDSGGSTAFHDSLRYYGLGAYNDTTRFTSDLRIIHAAVNKITVFHYRRYAEEIVARINAFLPGTARWKGPVNRVKVDPARPDYTTDPAYGDKYKAVTLRYYHRVNEELISRAGTRNIRYGTKPPASDFSTLFPK